MPFQFLADAHSDDLILCTAGVERSMSHLHRVGYSWALGALGPHWPFPPAGCKVQRTWWLKECDDALPLSCRISLISLWVACAQSLRRTAAQLHMHRYWWPNTLPAPWHAWTLNGPLLRP